MKSSMTDLLHEALYGLMIEVVGWNYDDEDGFAERARDILTRYDDQRKASYSQRCIDAALRQRRHAHSLMRIARKEDKLYPLPCGVKHIGWLDARDALRDAIRWIYAAKRARIREQQKEECPHVYRAAAE